MEVGGTNESDLLNLIHGKLIRIALCYRWCIKQLPIHLPSTHFIVKQTHLKHSSIQLLNLIHHLLLYI